MKILLLAAGGFLCAQAPSNVKPDLLVAEVNDEKITAARLKDVLQGAPPLALNALRSDPKEFLLWTWTMRDMEKEATAQGIDKKPPFSDRLKWSHGQILMMARMEEKNKQETPSDEQLRRHYAENAPRYGTAKVKILFISADPGKEAAAKLKAASVVKQLKGGASFVDLVKKYSDDPESKAKDGDFHDVGPESKLPPFFKMAIFQLKPGGVTELLQQPAGYYLFQLKSTDQKPFDEVKDKLRDEIRSTKVSGWMEEQRSRISVKILVPEFFKDLTQQVLAQKAQVATAAAVEIKPETVLAEVNGKPLTGADWTGIFQSIPPQQRQNAMQQPEEFLRQYGLMQILAASAVEIGLDKQQPYRGRLSYDHAQILTQALVDEYMNKMVILAEEQRKAFDSSPGRWRVATLRMLYVAYSLTPPPRTDPNAPVVLNELQAAGKIKALVAGVRSGIEPFAEAARKWSDDEKTKSKGGELPPMPFDSQGVPEDVKKAIFAAKKGEIVGPIKLPNGFYAFEVVDLITRNYEDVKDQIYDELRQQRFQAWFDGRRNGYSVKIVDADAFRRIAAN